MALSAHTGYIVPYKYEIYHVGLGGGARNTHHKTMKQNNEPRKSYTLWPGLYGDDPLDTVRLPQRGLSSQSLGKY